MEILQHVSNAQILYPVAAVVVVLICAALVFIFGFHSAEPPQFDKLPLVVDDRKSAKGKRKAKDKKSSPNRNANEDGKAKSESKKSPAKEKKEVKEAEKPKPKPAEPKVVKKETIEKKGKKAKNVGEAEKPADFDDGLWEEVPKKEKKKTVKSPEEKKEKESPAKKKDLKKKVQEADVEVAQQAEEPVEEKVKIVSIQGPVVDEEADRALKAQIEEVQRILKEAARREQAVLGGGDAVEDAADEAQADEPTDDEVKDLRSNKKKENKEKQKKKEAVVAAKAVAKADSVEKDSDSSDKQTEAQNAPVFDELGDTWTEAPKKSKKKVRKDQ